ncbi:10185_t:CDS:2, partial [Cetraspora pellucida]
MQGTFYYSSEEVSTNYDQYYQFEKYSQHQDSHLTRYGQQIETSPSHSPLCSLCPYFHAPQQFEMSTQAPVSLKSSSQLFVPTNLSNLSNSSSYDYQMLNYANNQFTNPNMQLPLTPFRSLKRFNSSLFIKKSDGTRTNILNDDDSLGVDDNLSSGTQSHHMALGFPPADTIVAKTQ